MNVYIDCGAYDGDTLDCEKLFKFKADYKIAFEPNPRFFSVLASKGIDELHNAVVWDKDEIVEFSVDQHEVAFGSTAMKSKKTFKEGVKYQLHAIDFSSFISDLYERLKVDCLLVKMDIEGAEFKVLEKLNKTGVDKLITELYVETHENKVPEYTGIYKNELLKRMNCGVYEWH